MFDDFVPLESVLSVLLFVIAFSVESVPEPVRHFLYVNGLIIYVSDDRVSNHKRLIQMAIN